MILENKFNSDNAPIFSFILFLSAIILSFILAFIIFQDSEFSGHYSHISTTIFPILDIHYFVSENTLAAIPFVFFLVTAIFFLVLLYLWFIIFIAKYDFNSITMPKIVFSLNKNKIINKIETNLSIINFSSAAVLFIFLSLFIFSFLPNNLRIILLLPIPLSAVLCILKGHVKFEFNKQFYFLVFLFIFSIAIRLLIVQTFNDVHTDEGLYLKMGRDFSGGKTNLHETVYPFHPILISIILSISQSQEFVSFVYLIIHSLIPVLAYIYLMKLNGEQISAVFFGLFSALSPLLILYSNRIFIDSVGLLLFLFISCAILSKRHPFYIGFLGAILFLTKLHYAIHCLYFLFLLLYIFSKNKIDRNEWFNFIIKIPLSFLLFYIPVLLIFKSGLFTGNIMDSNLSSLHLISFNQIIENLSQYANWAFLNTIYLHHGFDSAYPLVFFTGIISFLFLIAMGIFLSIQKKEISVYLLPLIFLLTLLTPQLIFLNKLYQRYSIFIHFFVYLFSISLLSGVIVRKVSASIYFTKLNLNPIRIKKLIFSLVLLFFIIGFFPMYSELITQENEFSRLGFKEGAEYIKINYDKTNTIVIVDDGWIGGWYFYDFKNINFFNGLDYTLKEINSYPYKNVLLFISEKNFNEFFKDSDISHKKSFNDMRLYEIKNIKINPQGDAFFEGVKYPDRIG